MPTAKFKGRDLKPHKAAVGALFGEKTVLTNSPWEFVSLWLRRQGHEDAGFYWNQARVFHQASASLPVESAPLLLYYTFMNAVKALLLSKAIAFNAYHGVRAHNMRGASRRIILSNEGVRIETNNNIVPALATYLGDTESAHTHSLQQIFYNLSFIHRTYCLTYTSQANLFLPVVDCEYFFDPGAHAVFFRAKLSKDCVGDRFIHRLPPGFVADPDGDEATIRSAASVPAARRIVREGAELTAVINLHRQLRADLHYINGSQTLWYSKGNRGHPWASRPVSDRAYPGRDAQVKRNLPLPTDRVVGVPSGTAKLAAERVHPVGTDPVHRRNCLGNHGLPVHDSEHPSGGVKRDLNDHLLELRVDPRPPRRVLGLRVASTPHRCGAGRD